MSEDEERRKALKPCVSLSDAVVLATEGFGLEPAEDDTPKQLDSYDDNNFYTPGSLAGVPGRYLLKVQNGVESGNEVFLDFQSKMMLALDEQAIRCPVPMPVADGSGSLIYYKSLPVHDGSEARLAIRLLKWVDGTPLVSMPCTAKALVNAGAYLGKLDKVLEGFDHPGAHRVHLWDLQRITGIKGFISAVKDPARRALVESVLQAFEEEVLPISEQFRRGVIMSDFNDANIIVDPGDVETVAGVIDFGDSCESWRVNDPAIAMAYAAVSAFGKACPVQAAAALLKGFVSEFALEPVEIKHLRTLAAGRLAISVTLGAYAYQKQPENTYLLIHSEPAWTALHTIWYSDRRVVDTLFTETVAGAPLYTILQASFPLITTAPSLIPALTAAEGEDGQREGLREEQGGEEVVASR